MNTQTKNKNGINEALQADSNGEDEADVPDPHIPYLPDKDYRTLSNYKHFAEKTMIELWLVQNIACHIEKLLPETWSANTVTVIGHIPMYLIGAIAVYYGGLKYHEDPGDEPLQPLPPWVLLTAAVCVQWFTLWDGLDGLRARRLKAGSPIGRLIDEAGDLMMYTQFALIGGYIFKAPPGLLCLCYAALNIPAYFLELTFVVTGIFRNKSGDFDFGPVECELTVTLVFILSAIYGYQGMDQPLNQYVPELVGNYIPDDIKLRVFCCVFYGSIIILFIIENLVESVRYNTSLTLKTASSPLVCLIPVVISAYLGLETYKNQFVLFHLLHSWGYNVQGYRLQVANMTRQVPLNPFGLETVIAFIPLVVHCIQPAWEPVATYISCAAMFGLFYGHMYLLSQQWLAYEKGKRKWWTIDPPSAKKD